MSSKLNTRHIKDATKEILEYIDNRRRGVVKPLRTGWGKLNKALLGGLEPNTIITIAGISGSGKSSFANTLETDLIDMNRDQNVIILNFNWEMLGSRQVARKLSNKVKKTTGELYSATRLVDGKSLTDEEYNKLQTISKQIEQYPIYYVDSPGTVDEVRSTIQYYQAVAEKQGAWLIVILDHVLLTKNKTGERERETLMNLQKVFIEAKKHGKTTIIQISQMNRAIEEKERVLNKMLHYPTRSDIFGSDSLFQASDVVMVLHRPELLGIVEYGIKNLPVTNRLYLHILKNREGELKILAFINELKYNAIKEANPYNTTKEN